MAKGHWIFYGRILKCSQCGGLNDLMEDTCPHCGTDMNIKGDENESKDVKAERSR